MNLIGYDNATAQSYRTNIEISIYTSVLSERMWEQHRGKTSAHAPNYENMAGNLNINF